MALFKVLALCQFTKYSNFIWLQLIFEQKPCILGPIKEETPWPNWHWPKHFKFLWFFPSLGARSPCTSSCKGNGPFPTDHKCIPLTCCTGQPCFNFKNYSPHCFRNSLSKILKFVVAIIRWMSLKIVNIN